MAFETIRRNSTSPSMLNPLEDVDATISLATTAEMGESLNPELESEREKWQSLIDHELIEWGRDPSQFDEEEIVPPSGQTIQRAIDLANLLGSNGFPSPTRVIPDAHGGIVFERRNGEEFETIRINDDGTVACCRFSGSDLIAYESW